MPTPTLDDTTRYAPFERYRSLVPDWEAFTEALDQPLPGCIWANTLRTSPDELARWLADEGLPVRPLPWYPGAFQLPADVKPGTTLPYLAGLYHVQEEVSLLPVVFLDPQPGERILDLCAAPGNKTAQIGVAMRNRGTLVANDRNEGRLHVLRTTLSRLGIVNVATTCHDATAYPSGEAYDRVLADVPCSCEGTSRKHPGVVAKASREQSCRMGRRQRQILERAVALCRPGGRIVYATCTYAPEENELVVDDVLQAFGERVLRLLPARREGLRASEGLTAWEGRTLHPSLRQALRVWPHQNDSGGFFVAVLEKRTEHP